MRTLIVAITMLGCFQANPGIAAMAVDPGCGDVRFQWIEDPTGAVAAQPRFESHPYFMKVRMALGDPSYNFYQELHAPTIKTKGANGQVVLPIAKREAFTQGVFVMGHFKVRDGQADHRLVKITDGDYLMYDMDMHRVQAYKELKAEYDRQGLPRQAWEFIEMQEFSLAESRKVEIAVTHEGRLAGFMRVYNSSTNDQLMAGNFETAIPKGLRKTVLTGMNVNQGHWDWHVSPAERLAHALHMDNPYKDLREQFPDLPMIEVGRMLVARDLPRDVAQHIKQLMWTGAMDVAQQMAGGDLGQAVMIASGGPFGARYYPKTYNWHPVAEKKITDWHDLELRPAPGAEGELMTIFTPDPAAAMNRASQADLEKVKPVTFFATSGRELTQALSDQGLLLKDYPTTFKMASGQESELLPWQKPLPQSRFPIEP